MNLKLITREQSITRADQSACTEPNAHCYLDPRPGHPWFCAPRRIQPCSEQPSRPIHEHCTVTSRTHYAPAVLCAAALFGQAGGRAAPPPPRPAAPPRLARDPRPRHQAARRDPSGSPGPAPHRGHGDPGPGDPGPATRPVPFPAGGERWRSDSAVLR